jgi:hypothetical protein
MNHLLLMLAIAVGGAEGAPAPAQETAPIFRMETGEFWVNLHHFLYVLGRAEAGERDATREAVAGAPEDARRAMRGLSAAEREAWAEAVSAYAADLSRKDAVFDDGLPVLVAALAAVDDAPSLRGAGVDPAVAAVLERAAPIYRKAWWPAHRAANEGWATSLQPLIDEHGRGVLAYITRAYGLPWPDDGYPVHVAAYTNWAGAYSTSGNLLMVASLSKGNAGLYGLELTFHEAMHQWDDEVWEALLAHARQQKIRISGNIRHAMIFFTAGEAVRHVVPSHVPYAEAFGIWQRGMGRFKPALDEVWKPWLEGRGTRGAALAALAARAVIPR